MAIRILIGALSLAVAVCMASCQNPAQPAQAKPVAAVKKPAACCTGKTPPRFGLKAPVAPQKEQLDSLAKSAKN
ncbi:hypothetical protein [Mucilaginibacter terrae]|uniref:Uncharacterized protein n=1 Tax=Mucilaginibacter terrae TaxID=1955052 RepID=A0ABU3GQZ5_9SPHI|nr:hypothetical protein [Mucilaginibacter terrae]MDT3402203.1 hypothetical protein [Mucilaginibacter terrae]